MSRLGHAGVGEEKARNLSFHQITAKLGNRRLRYCDLIISNLTAVRYIGFHLNDDVQ